MNKTENLKTMQAVVLLLVLVLFFSVLAYNQTSNYKDLFNQKYSDYITAFVYAGEVLQQYNSDNSLLSDKSWQAKMVQSFENLNLKADELAQLKPTPKYVELHSITVRFANETHFFTEAFIKGVINLDVASLDRARQHLGNMGALEQDMKTEMQKIEAAP